MKGSMMSNWFDDHVIIDGLSDENAQKLKDALIDKLVESAEEDES
jgi:ribosomal silencing factor RsfS